MKKIIALLICMIITLLYPKMGYEIASTFSQQFGITWNYIHHLVQFALALLTILIFLRIRKDKSISDFGFNLKNRKWSLKTVLNFTIGWILITTIFNLIFTFKNHVSFETNGLNIFTSLFFDFIITPISEETLFRGLIFSLLLMFFPGKLRIGKFSVSYSVLLSTLFFSLAHIGIDYQNLTIIYIDFIQLVFTIGLGIFYAIMREKSQSLLGPMIAHGVSDGVIKTVQLIIP
ncbi:CAAX amino terminal protease self- immunity [Salinivirga cyanobacteriivorans]|uniref:CAAX amino terminal protease self-immunity n=1 Tax=Salinivirga cyanobacteriivorans TaxID=1307839 RepID=A0A0S2I3D0_9BACT|nr:CPBP family intramembrane glutamic endopeptidase [Salinivirga cyanobacteriivorans]ALO16799.1 CAAX amino terminal protease self- immunity [Salinivirga cyanobacteriivorans]